MSNKEQLFTDLSNEQASIVEGGALTLYRDIDRKGGGINFYSNQSELKSLNFNDEASSVQISSGETWVLYEHNNFQGKRRILTAGTWNLTDFDFNDKVSSFKRYA